MELFSRYGDRYEISELENGDLLFVIPRYTRILYGDETSTIIAAIDPPGGPMISIGDKLGDKEIIEIIDLNPNGFEILLKTKKEG